MLMERQVYDRPEVLTDCPTHYCPGCHHGVAHRLLAELLEELNLVSRAVAVSSIGCSVFLYNYFKVDAVEAPHGRAPAVATGFKRARPGNFVFTYQGDGDLASIGLSEIVHAGNRGERITVVFVNNTVFGMTGGQMAPTTLPGQKTTTSPLGRSLDSLEGSPLRMAEIMADLPGVAFSARAAMDAPGRVRTAKKAMRMAFQAQLDNAGLGFVELLSACPTNWKMTPAQAADHVAQALIPAFPLGTFKPLASRAAS